MFVTYKYRLYPNKKQQEYFAKCFGCVRFIYNRMLADKIDFKETKEAFEELKEEYAKKRDE